MDLLEYQAKLDQIKSADLRTRAERGRWTQSHIASLRRSSEICAHEEDKAAYCAAAVIAEETNGLIDDARKPLLVAGFKRNAYAGKCSKCSSEVGEGLGWGRKVGGKWRAYCPVCVWDALPKG